MPKSYSVADARKLLPRLLHDVEDGQQVEITRRGQPVAVVISLADYQRLTGTSSGFTEAYRAWRASIDSEDLELPEDYFDQLRDSSLGREVEL